MKKNKILITGAAGFIGFSLAKKLLENKKNVIIALDNFDDYYDVKLKRKRISLLKKNKNFFLIKIDLNNFQNLKKVFLKNKFTFVYHLAAQAGVRYSLLKPRKYLESNINGFFNLLECCRGLKLRNFFFASSSSIYGDQKKYPLSEKSPGIQKNIYSLSKMINEEFARIYSELYGLKLIGLRFFTVYGPWGRPDMFYYKFMSNIKKKIPTSLYNNGNHYRDFTYIDDVVEILISLSKIKFKKNYDVLNICSSRSESLIKFTKLIERYYAKKAIIKNKKRLNLEVLKTHGDNSKILKLINKKRFIKIEQGLEKTVKWFKSYNKV
jgi:UDP-glucuronate 4-epimerase